MEALHAALHATQHFVSPVVHTAANPIMREMEFEVNAFAPNIWPDHTELFELYYQGRLSYDELSDALSKHGIALNAKRGYAKENVLWQNILDIHRPAFEPQLARSLFRQNIISPFDFSWHTSRHGMYDKDMREQFLRESEFLSPQELVACWQRQLINDLDLPEMLKARGFVEPEQVDLLKKLSFEIPGPSDLVHFSIREVWDPDVTTRFGHDDEFRPQFQFWMERQGAGGDARTPIEIAAGAAPFTWAKAHWRSHWVTISPSQAYTFQGRLRPDRIHIYQDQFPDIQEWTPDDTRLALKANDYPPPFRDRMAAVAYNVLGRIDTRRLYAAGIIDEEEVNAIYQDQLYSARDANFLTKFTIKQERIRRSKLVRSDSKGRVLAAYETGILDSDTALVQLFKLGLEDPDDLEAFDAKPFADQVQRAKADSSVTAALQAIDLAERIKSIGEWIKVIGARYLKGLANRVETEGDLASLGLQRWKVEDRMAIWDAQLKSPRKSLSAAQILRWLTKGIVALPVAQQRLANLGFDQVDIAGMILETQMGMQVQATKAAAAQAKDLAAKQKAIVAAQKAMVAQQRQFRADLAKHGSPAQLQAWYAAGLIDEAGLRARLAALAWPATDIDLAYGQAEQRRQAAEAKAHKVPAYPKAAGAGHPAASVLQKEFKAGKIDETEFRSELAGLGWEQSEIDAFVESS